MDLFLEIRTRGEPLGKQRLAVGKNLVGRHPGCDVRLPDQHVSRQQLTIEVDESGSCRLADLGSKNPVLVNDEPVMAADLVPGDRIVVGESQLVLRTSEEFLERSSVSLIPPEREGPHPPLRRLSLEADASTNFLPPRDAHDREKLAAFYALAQTLARGPDPDDFFGSVLDLLFDALPAARGFVGLGNPEQGTFQVVRVRNDRKGDDSAIEMSQTILDEIHVERKALLVEDAARDLAYPGAQSIVRLGITSFMCAPMFTGGEFLGVIYLDQVEDRRRFEEGDLAFLQSVARLCALTIDNLRHKEELARENRSLRAILERKGRLIAKSARMVEILRKLPRVAEHDSPVLITGETGTGKELIARAIHDGSPRRDKPFVAFNCALSNPALIESELFGHVKGAFTDASRDHKGKFEQANGGTLFLDEIGDMPLATQVKILRALQERRIEPVGGEGSIPIDLRLISATHRDLAAMREKKSFREDLYYRIAVLTIDLPPLRERGEDILEIAHALLPEGLEIESAATNALLAYAWPGNIRQLQNVLEQACFNATGTSIRLQDLPAEIAREGRRARIDLPLSSLAEVEAKHIRKVLKTCKGNKKRTAEILGISRETLYQKLKLYEIPD